MNDMLYVNTGRKTFVAQFFFLSEEHAMTGSSNYLLLKNILVNVTRITQLPFLMDI